MKIRSIAFFIAAACTVVICSAGAGTVQRTPERNEPVRPLPDSKKDCSLCHVLFEDRAPKELRQTLSRLCLDCHGDRGAPGDHRVGVAPARDVKGLPLASGKMTCITCHDPHSNANAAMLRMPAAGLCLVCHPK